jgi:phage gpG-like protein
MPISGNLNALKELSDKIRQLTSSGFKAELSKELAATAWRETLAGFRESRDPYGNPWRPLAWRKGTPLIDSGQMRQSVSTEATGNGFRLRIGVLYASIHQYGAKVRAATRARGRGRVGSVPRRQMVPEKDTGGLGPIWLTAFNRTAEDLIRRRLGRAA